MDQANSLLLRYLVSTLVVLVLANYAFAGAPAPRPDTSGPHTPEHQLASLGSFRFESGEIIEDLKVSYVTHGKLNAARDNAILVLNHFTSDHHGLDHLIGPGKALDPGMYFIIATDFLANASLRQDLTTGPTNSGLRMHFPRITARDWVNADFKLLKEYLGIDHLLAAIGASIGGINAYQLAVSHPEFVSCIVPLVASPHTNPQTRLLLRHVKDTIAMDPSWYGGMYQLNPITGVVHALIEMTPWWRSYEFYSATLTTSEKMREEENFWHHLWSAIAPQDARDVYYQLDGWAEFNIGDTPGFRGGAKNALSTIRARALLIGIEQDQLVRHDEMQFAKEAIGGAKYLELSSPYGHTAFIADPKVIDVMNREIAGFLRSVNPK